MSPSDNYKKIVENIESIKSSYGIGYNIEIVVVSKYANVEDILELISNAEIKHIGENRVQEAEAKFTYLEKVISIKNIYKHMLGTLQSNKLAKVSKLFDYVQSIEDVNKALGIQNRNPGIKLFIEVKTSYEFSKHGATPEEAYDLFGKLREKGILICGLMTIAPNTENLIEISNSFSTLRKLKEKIEKDFSVNLEYLSMGMSSDYEIAIKEGSNMVRLGSVIFKK